jgi:hypothetical protein
MKSISIAGFQMPVPPSAVPRHLAVAAATTAFADWLFYDHGIGLSLVLFLLVLTGLALLTNRSWISRREAPIALMILIAGLAPIIEAFNVLSVLFGVLAVAVAVSSLTHPFITTWRDRFEAVGTLLLAGPFRLVPDIARSRIWSVSPSRLTVWIVPLFLSVIFLGLFASANPLIENMLAAFDLHGATSHVSFARLLFWSVTLSVIWPFIALRWDRKAAVKACADVAQPEAASVPPPDAYSFSRELLGPEAILRSLVLFNLLFAVQTTLDLIYLWGGAALPDGMTYATYAHHGAYPLMLTALLAGGFVLATIRPGGPVERKPLIRMLVFVWIAQNVMLVVSSILRLDLYIETYALSYWRVTAFIWMLLVALGLVLIVARIALDRSNQWLVLANLTTLTLVLYACTFINFPWVIATYNVAHSREISGKGASVDFPYLVSLGPQALPAIDRYLDQDGHPCCVWKQQRDGLVQRHAAQLDSWRAWGFRDWRLTRYLDRIAQNSTAMP